MSEGHAKELFADEQSYIAHQRHLNRLWHQERAVGDFYKGKQKPISSYSPRIQKAYASMRRKQRLKKLREEDPEGYQLLMDGLLAYGRSQHAAHRDQRMAKSHRYYLAHRDAEREKAFIRNKRKKGEVVTIQDLEEWRRKYLRRPYGMHGQGMIRLRKDGRWEVRINLLGGKKKSLYARSFADAQSKLIEARALRKQSFTESDL